MAEHLTLSIFGSNGESVPNQFLRQKGDTKGLAILLPGLGYTCDMPVFYYTELQFLVVGFDVLRVDYDYRSRNADDLEELVRHLYADVEAAVYAGTSQRHYMSVAVVGKSLRTMAMAHLASEGISSSDWTTVWLTPLLKEDAVYDAIITVDGPAALVIGSDDHHYDQARLDSLAVRDNITVIVQSGGNHSLNSGSSAGESAHSLANIIDQLDAFYEFERSNRNELD